MTKAKERATPLFKSRDLLTWDEAAAYLGPSFTERWLKRQVYEFKTINAVRVGGRRVIPRAELDRYLDERIAQAGR